MSQRLIKVLTAVTEHDIPSLIDLDKVSLVTPVYHDTDSDKVFGIDIHLHDYKVFAPFPNEESAQEAIVDIGKGWLYDDRQVTVSLTEYQACGEESQ